MSKDILDKVKDRYDIAELAEQLEMEYILDDAPDMEVNEFVQVFKEKILKNQRGLDIWSENY
jgi:hypothetical protein